MNVDVTEDVADLAKWLNESQLPVEREAWFTSGALWALARVSGVAYPDLSRQLTDARAQGLTPSMPPMRQPFATGGVVSPTAALVAGEQGWTRPSGVGIRGVRRGETFTIAEPPDLLGTDDAPPAMPDTVSDEERQMVRDIAMLAAKDQAQAEHPSAKAVWADVPGASRFVIKREAIELTPIGPDEPTAPPDPMSQGEIARRHGPIIEPATDEEMAELAAEASDEEREQMARMAAAVKAQTEAMKR